MTFFDVEIVGFNIKKSTTKTTSSENARHWFSHTTI